MTNHNTTTTTQDDESHSKAASRVRRRRSLDKATDCQQEQQHQEQETFLVQPDTMSSSCDSGTRMHGDIVIPQMEAAAAAAATYSTAPLTSIPPPPPPDASERDFSDMPSLSSYRSWDEKSAASSPKGSGAGADCDMSLPSLSSYRWDEVSMASSYHSRGSAATNHLSHYSEESAEGWASFTSGNVSKSDLDTDDDDDDDDNKSSRSGAEEEGDSCEFACASREGETEPHSASSSLQDRTDRGRPSTVDVSNPSSAFDGISSSLPPAAIETKSILRNKGDVLSSSAAIASASQVSLISFDSASNTNRNAINSGAPIKPYPPLPRSSNSSLDDSLARNFTNPPLHEGLTSNLPDAESRFLADSSCITESNVATANAATVEPDNAEVRRDSIPERGSLGRNVSMSLSELQRVPSDQPSSSSFRHSADGSSSSLRGGGDSLPRLPRRTSTMAVDNDHRCNNSSSQDIEGKGTCKTDEVSVSDSSSDGGLSLGIETDGDDESIDCSVDTNGEDDGSEDEDSLSLGRTSAEFSVVSGASIPSDTAHSVHEEDPASVVKRGSTGSRPRKKRLSAERLATSDTIDTIMSDDTITKTAVPQKSNSDPEMSDVSRMLAGAFVSLTRRKSSSDQASAAGNTGEESGTSATETELEESDAARNGAGKRGTLIRRMSSSLRNVRLVGKSASFRAIGKTASKIRHLSRRKDKEPPGSLERSTSDGPRST